MRSFCFVTTCSLLSCFALGNRLTFTCSQKFYKLKKESEAMLKGEGVDLDAITPVKAKTPKTPGSKATSGRKRKADAGADKAATPTKRGKAKKSAPVEAEVKVEMKTKEANQDVEDECKGETEVAE
jgi:hypothetical protein